ncbi:MAG: hypothetical protein ACE5IR_21725 [bacterium]
MDLQIDMNSFDKKVDEETGSILFYKKGFQGIPDRVLQGDGFTVEIKDDDVVMFDIYNPEYILSKLLRETVSE